MSEIGPALKSKFTGIVRFDIEPGVGTWTLDLKTGDGAVINGAQADVKPDLVIKVADDDFSSLYEGRVNAQQVRKLRTWFPNRLCN